MAGDCRPVVRTDVQTPHVVARDRPPRSGAINRMPKSLLMSVLLVQILAAQRTSIIKTPRGDLEFTLAGARVNQVAGVTLGSIIDGSVRNPMAVDINYLRFEFVYLDQDGSPLDVCNVLGNPDRICTLIVFDTIPSGAAVPLRNPGNRFNPGKPVPKTRAISGFTTRLIEARYSPHYSFDFKAKEMPQFEASFTIGVEDGVTFVLKNKLESPIEILWDQSSFINERDESSRLVHAGVKYTDKDRPQPNTVIPPLAKVSETVYPSNYVRTAGTNGGRPHCFRSTSKSIRTPPHLMVWWARAFGCTCDS
jgi:hypothetical protein